MVLFEMIDKKDFGNQRLLQGIHADLASADWEIVSLEIGTLRVRVRALGERVKRPLAGALFALNLAAACASLSSYSVKDVVTEPRRLSTACTEPTNPV